MAFHQKSKPGITNSTEEILEHIKILWDRGNSILTTKAKTGYFYQFLPLYHCMFCSNVAQWLHRASVPSNFSKLFLPLLDAECEELFLKAMTAITITVLNGMTLALHRD